MGSKKVCVSLGIVLHFIYARWKINIWGLLASVIFYGILPFYSVPYGVTPRISLCGFNQDPFLKIFVYSYWIRRKAKGRYITPKTALYPKASINFILKRNSDLCHSGLLWLCLQKHAHSSGNCSSTTALRFPSKICPRLHPPSPCLFQE